MWAMLRIARPSWRSHSMSLRLDRRDSQRRSSVGMAEQLEDDRGGEGRGHGFLAQHVEQRAVVRFERHAFDREIGAGVGIVVAPQGGFGRAAACIVERADLTPDRVDVYRHGPSSRSWEASRVGTGCVPTWSNWRV